MHTSAQTQTTQTVALYMAEAGRYPLLNRDQEIELAAQVEQGKAATRTLAETHPLNARTRKALSRTVARGEQAQQRLIECNLRLVVHIAHRYIGCGLPLEDLVQEGNIGLMEAAERYDHKRGNRFSTYAKWWIKRAILQAAATQGQAIRLPPWLHEDLYRLKTATARLEARLERAPTPDEVAAELGVSVHRLRQVSRWGQVTLSFETPVGADQEYTLGDVLPDQDAPALDDTMAHLQLREKLREIMDAHLGPKERTYLSVRFGLDGGPGRTLKQAARALGLTKTHASAVERRALKQLRYSGSLRDFR